MTRREVLALALSAPLAGLLRGRASASQGLGQFTAGAPPDCTNTRKLTPAADDKQFRTGSPARTSLADATTPGKKLTLTGFVIGLRCGAIKGATVDVWQADAKGVFDPAGFRLRGHQLTSADGRYHVETIVPGQVAGRPRYLGVRVQPPGKPALSTLLFFSDDPASAKDPAVKPEQIMKVADGKDGATATMDLVLDL
jgi:protocatechuate 3,4-dioxygenase beta subunit